MPDQVPPSRGFIVGLVLALLALAVILVLPFLGAIVLAVLIGFLMQPVQRRMVRIVRSPSFAALLGVLLFAIVLFLPIALIVRELVAEAAIVIAFVQDPDGFSAWLDTIAARFGMERGEAEGFIERALTGIVGALQGALVPTIARAVNLVAGLVVFFFLLFFVLRDGEDFVVIVKELTPLRQEARDRLFTLIAARTKAISLGTFLVSIAQGVAAGLGWWFFGFPAPVFWAFVMTVIAVLPLGAPMVVMVPAGIIAILQGDLFAGIGILVYGAVVVGLLDNILRPFVVGRGSDAHPAVILIGTIGGLVVFGVSGFLLGPLFLSLLGPVLRVWAEEQRATHQLL